MSREDTERVLPGQVCYLKFLLPCDRQVAGRKPSARTTFYRRCLYCAVL